MSNIKYLLQDEPEKKRVLAAGGFISDGRINSNLNLSRAIGDFGNILYIISRI